ncbi:HRDC domain-containing protein [Streptomyces sp. NPDC088135]|uniref:HRDC domain-containing protein n=1 Tax=Streptomyces sp. NPDC088135 TaxID=3160993 RepID=UPI00344452D1
MHDATLREIATVRPDSVSALGGISGLGEKKLATYGEGVLEVLASFGEAAPAKALAEPAPAREAAPAPAPATPAAPEADPEFGWDEEPPEYE